MSTTLTVIQLRDPRTKEKWIQLDENGHIWFNSGTHAHTQLQIKPECVDSFVPIAAPSYALHAGGFPEHPPSDGVVLAIDKDGVLVSMDSTGMVRRYALSSEPVNLNDVNARAPSAAALVEQLQLATSKKINTIQDQIEQLKIQINNATPYESIKPADDEPDSWFERVKDKISDMTSDEDKEARAHISRIDSWLTTVDQQVQQLCNEALHFVTQRDTEQFHLRYTNRLAQIDAALDELRTVDEKLNTHNALLDQHIVRIDVRVDDTAAQVVQLCEKHTQLLDTTYAQNAIIDRMQSDQENVQRVLADVQSDQENVQRVLADVQSEQENVSRVLADVQSEQGNVRIDAWEEMGVLRNDIHNQTQMLAHDITELRENQQRINDGIDKLHESLSTEKIVLGKQMSLVANDGDLKINDTYCVVKETFTAHENLRVGDIVGLNHAGRIERVRGAHWSAANNTGLANDEARAWYWDSYDLHNDMCLRVVHRAATLTLCAEQVERTGQIGPSVCVEQILARDVTQCVACIVKISENPKRYVVGFTTQNNPQAVTLVKICVARDLSITECGTTVHIGGHTIDTFTLAYDPTSTLDTIALIGYNAGVTVFGGALFIAHSTSNEPILARQLCSPIVAANIVCETDQTIKAEIIAGDMVVFAYGNFKSFIILPATADVAPSVCVTGYYDQDSIGCADMIYDPINSAMISVEKTLAGTAYLRVLDVGPTIRPLVTKRLGQHTIVPIGLAYDAVRAIFALFACDAESQGQLCLSTFCYDGERVTACESYKRSDPMLFNYIDASSMMPNIKSRCVFSRQQSVYQIYVSDGETIYELQVDSCYGVEKNAFIGIVEESCLAQQVTCVAVRGQIFTNREIALDDNFIGCKVYIDSQTSDEPYPCNVTTVACGNTPLGRCVSNNKIIVGI